MAKGAGSRCWSCCCLSSDCARANPLSGGKTPKRKTKPAAAAPMPSVKIAGVCSDENGKPLKDVHVELYQEEFQQD